MSPEKAETGTVKGTLTENQIEAIDALIGDLGSNRQDVVGNILIMWMYQEGYIGDID